MSRKKSRLNLDLLNQRATSEFEPTLHQDKENNDQKLIPLGAILERHGGDTRAINPGHVAALVESISVIGLITPLTVDMRGRLLAGGHRLAALQQLASEQQELFSELFPTGVPVRVMQLDSETDQVDALQIEVEENTQRRNFTPTEIKEAARRLEAAGYERLKGRPRKGQKSLKRELAHVFRLSEDRIQRILNDSSAKGRSTPTFSIDNAIETLEKWTVTIEKSQDLNEADKINKQMKTLIRTLKKEKNNAAV